jgi:hypothetical protein
VLTCISHLICNFTSICCFLRVYAVSRFPSLFGQSSHIGLQFTFEVKGVKIPTYLFFGGRHNFTHNMWLLVENYWSKASVAFHVCPTIGLLELAYFPRLSDSKERGEDLTAFLPHHFHQIQFFRNELLSLVHTEGNQDLPLERRNATWFLGIFWSHYWRESRLDQIRQKYWSGEHKLGWIY